ncbi:MAG: PAS domain S-box protein [Alteromonadaceae bacterium]|nr:PAS domain S-box protein [Alteromonadaceae bacterium]
MELMSNKAANLPLELFYSVLKATVDTVVIVDAQGTILWVNNAFAQLTGYSYKEVLGKDTRLLKSGKQSEQFYQNMWNTLASGKVWQGELWNRKKDGSLYFEDQTITPVMNNEVISYYVAIKRDISEKVAIKKQLEHAEKMDVIGQLVGGISHNFNNKLATILGYVDLSNELPLSLPFSHEKSDSYLAKIQLAALDAKKLVSQLQIFCREEGQAFKTHSLPSVVNDILPIATNLLPQNIKLTFSHDNHNELINADVLQLQQMLMILIKNSIKAITGMGNIIISVNKVTVAEQTCCGCHQPINGTFIALSIEDNGQGIEAKYLPKLFLPFFTTRIMDGSTGMGLSVLHGMLHEHNGHIVVTSKVKQKTTFTLLFPVIEQIASAKISPVENTNESDNENTNKNDSKAHILFVDDEQIVVDLFTEILMFSGYKVTAETNVQSALALFIQQPKQFNLVIADQNMHGLTGLMLIRAIKNIDPTIATILISGNERAEFEQDLTFIETVDGFLMKPFKTTELQVLVEKLLQHTAININKG